MMEAKLEPRPEQSTPIFSSRIKDTALDDNSVGSFGDTADAIDCFAHLLQM